MADKIPCVEVPDTCKHVDDAADKAVKKVFAILGVNVDEPKDVEEFRQDLRFSASLRSAVNRGALAVIGVLITGVASALWKVISNAIGGGNE
jgi:hypothetical protein